MGAVVQFPRGGFIIGAAHCGEASDDRQSICLRDRGHDGDHQWQSWSGCRIRTPVGLLPFGGFAG